MYVKDSMYELITIVHFMKPITPEFYVFGSILFRTVSWVRKTNVNRFLYGSIRVIGKKLKINLDKNLCHPSL